ncbi:MAG TPA: GDSL-type esterase/lipase family protein [Acetobacteraceae bacterium]|nr:GDSL-type esterase/lipase family protein [Acetobacteraceae bacterium]
MALLILAMGVATWDPSYPRWGALGVALYAVPLACCAFRSVTIRVWGFAFGIFMVVQSVASVLLPSLPNDYVTLPHRMRLAIDVEASNIPGISGIQNVTTDEQGYRVMPPVDYGSADAFRIFVIGGSTTESILLDDQATWPHLLQEALNATLGRKVVVVNTGVSGLRARNHLATLSHILDQHPSAVIFLIGANDWGNQIRSHFATVPLWFEAMRLRRTLLGLALLRLSEGDPLARLNGTQQTKVEHGDGYRRWQHSLDRPDKRRFTPAAVSAGYVDYLERISSLCHEHNLTCIFVTQPTAYSLDASAEVRANFWGTPGFSSFTLPLEDMIRITALHNNYLVSFAREHDHPVCDLAAKLEGSFDSFYDEVHFNTDGARKVAKELVPCVAAALRGQKSP